MEKKLFIFGWGGVFFVCLCFFVGFLLLFICFVLFVIVVGLASSACSLFLVSFVRLLALLLIFVIQNKIMEITTLCCSVLFSPRRNSIGRNKTMTSIL